MVVLLDSRVDIRRLDLAAVSKTYFDSGQPDTKVQMSTNRVLIRHCLLNARAYLPLHVDLASHSLLILYMLFTCETKTCIAYAIRLPVFLYGIPNVLVIAIASQC